ncbi:MAG: hypothetical protein CL840_02645, partial [Crocinitomicaceae bacterium]|nr:hypothetical protein [Crocinitomicaceae bacterium]
FGGSSQTNVLCKGASTGSITVVPAGGTAPYPTFAWNPNVSTTASATNLSAGNYTVTVTDNNGCTNDTTFTITEPAAGMTSSMAILDTINCKGGNNGRVSVTPAGGTTPYTYNWSAGNGGVNDSISGALSAGKVVVTITDAGGCSIKDSITLSEPATAITGVFVDKKNPTCTGSGNDGSIKISVSGGTPSYTYTWTGSGTSSGPTDSTRSNMTAGPISVLVTDSKGCTDTFTDTLVSPGSLSVTFTDTILPTCYGDTNGRLIATHTGGTGTVSYSWTATQGMTGATDSIWVNAKSETITVEVTDTLGCKASVSINLPQPDSILINVNVLSHVLCKGDSTGSVRAVVTGGTPGYTYNWNGIGTPVTGADSMRQNIWAGNFTLTVTDSKGCSNSKPYTITEPALGITGVTFADTVLCRSSTTGTGRIVASGGTKPYTYNWSAGNGGTNDSVSTNMPGGPFTVTVTDAGGCSQVFMDTITSPDSLKGTFTQITQPGCGSSGALGSVTVTPTGGTPNASSPLYSYTWIGGGINGSNDSIRINIPAGTIRVVITDKNGCMSDTLSQALNAPGNLNPTFSLIQDPKCNGDSTGSVIVTPTGGTPGYTYVWNLGVSGSSDSIRNSLPGGVQIEVIITDAASCVDTAKITLNNPVGISLTFTDSTLPACAGDTNGTITVTPLGGLKPYTYSWSNGDNDSIANNVGGGIFYKVTVTDGNGCTSIDSLQISDPAPMTVSFTDSASIDCNGGSNGSLTITPSGGTPIYGYAWTASSGATVSTGASDSIATGLVANVLYTVTVTDGKGCKASASKSMDEPNPITAVGVGGAARCGAPNGTARLIFIRGGTPGYTVSWDSAGTSFGTGNPKTGLYAGVYTATVTDSKGCTETFQVNVSNRQAPIIILDSLQDAFCEGVCSGGIDIRVISFGGIPVTYKWSNGDTTQDIVKQCAGGYTVTVTDTNGCIRVQNFTIGVQDTLNLSLSTTPLSCNATVCDGVVSATPTKGFPPYSYVWSSSSTDTLSSITNRCAGKYIVTVTDTKGCIAKDSATLASPTNLTITSSADSVSCNGGNNGVASVTSVTGGLAPIKYQWSTGANDTFAIKSALSAGTYYVTVSEAGGCSVIDTVVVEEPNGMSATTIPVLADCGQSNGKITINVTGGKSPLSYNWPVGGIKALNTDSGYSAGAYNVIVSDGNGCNATFPFNISNKNGPVVTLDSIKHETCFGDCDGGIFVSVTAGSPNYVYLWSPGGSTNQDLTSACPGPYDLRVTDQKNCITLYSDTVEAATKVVPNATVVNHATSRGSCDGRAKATPTGGSPGYTYKWSSGSVSDTANGLCAGDHYVTVTDSKGCTAIDTVTITEPLNLVLDSVHKYEATCQKVPCDGRMRIFVSGGSGSYTYIWDNGDATDSTFNRCAGTLVVTVSDGSIVDTFSIPLSETKSSVISTATVQDVSCNGGSDGSVYAFLVSGQSITSWSWSPSGGTSDTAKNLTAGFYTVSATNSFGCDSYDTIEVKEPNVIVTSSDTTSPNCGSADGQIIARVTGGTQPYSIQWLDGSMSPLVPPQTGDTAKNLASGIYHYRVTDRNGCTATQQVILIDKNAPVIRHDSTRDVSCFGKCDGGIFITATGGTGSLSYLWSPGGKTTPDLDTACSGIYSVRVTDGAGCSSTFQDTIDAGSALMTTVTKLSDVSSSSACDGAASVSVSGGKPTYKYLWTGGGTLSVVNNLCKGMNYVTVTDSNGCSGVDSVLILEPNVLTLTKVDTNQPACGKCDGKIKITVSGGTTPYTYKWDNGDTADSTLNRCAGVIQVTVSDAGSLSQVFNIGLNSSNAPSISVVVTDASCNGACDGSATATASLGTAPYSYNWPTIAVTGQTITGRCKGVYLVEVRDSKGCIATDSADIKEPTKIVANVNVTIADCGKSNGSATVSAVGGKTPYTYKWSSGPTTTTPTLTGLAAGAYFVTVEDTSKCSVVLPFSIVNPNGPTITIDTVNNATCNNSCDGSIFITASGTPGPYSYKWTPGGSTSEDISNLCTGVYTVEVTDFNKCISVAFDTVKGPPAPGQTITVSNHATAYGRCDGKVYITIPGGTSGYNFQWTSSEVGDTAKTLCAGVNYVTITDSKGCQFIDSVVITQPRKMIISSRKVVNPNCNVCDGKITVSIAGGTPPYTYLWGNGDTTDSTVNRCAGVLFLTVTDKNNYSEVFQIGLNNKTSPNVSYTKTDARCANSCDGQINVAGSGTIAPYSYNWPTLGSRNDTVTGLCSGTYLVEVKDKVGCLATQSITIDAPTPIKVSFTKTLPKCGINSGLIFSGTSGGTPKSTGYDYSWLDNAQFAIVPAQTSDKLLNVGAGLYHLAVTDSMNCIDTFAVTLNNIGGASIALDSLKNASCAGVCDGEISITASKSPVTYLWFPGGATTKAVSGLCAGNHTIQVTDTGNCKTLNTFTVTAPEALKVVAREIIDASCFNTNDGEIRTLVNETGLITYQWSGVDSFAGTTADAKNLLAGNYKVVATNAKGCVDSTTATVGIRVNYSINAGGDSAYCGSQTVPIWNQTISSGFYTTTWYDEKGVNLGQRDSITVTPTTGRHSYRVEVRQEVCVQYDTVVVIIEDEYELSAGKDRTIVKGQRSTIGGNPTAPSGKAIVWSPSEGLDDVTKQNPVAIPSVTTMYIVSGGKEGGCIVHDTVLVKVEDRIVVNDAFSPNGDGVNDTWEIGIINDYPNAKVQIFNRWGQVLYESYPYVPWDGKYKNEDMPLGTYYYIIDLNDDSISTQTLSGAVTIIR